MDARRRTFQEVKFEVQICYIEGNPALARGKCQLREKTRKRGKTAVRSVASLASIRFSLPLFLSASSLNL